jgi:hypothetical protein
LPNIVDEEDPEPDLHDSLGCPAIFLIGTETRSTVPLPILLRSGDMVIMSGPCRRVFHGVPRIFEPQIVEEWLSRRKNEGSRTEDKEGENGARYEASCQEGDR